MSQALAAAVARRSMTFATRAARASAAGSMNSLVVITRPSDQTEGDYDLVTREYTPGEAAVIYDDEDTPGAGAIAGITVAQGPLQMDLGDEPQYYSSLTVYIPSPVPSVPRINDLVHVIASPDQPIIGRWFRVMDVPVGGRIDASFELQCQGIAPSREWSEE